MKKISLFASIAVAVVFSVSVLAETPAEKGTKLMKMNDDRPTFQKSRSEVTLKIYSSSGRLRFTKKLAMASYTENLGAPNELEKYISAFLSPADDMGNAYLAYNYKAKGLQDMKMLYLKGIRKAKKVTGADKKLPFFGSDFFNNDMGKPDFTEWTYKWLRDDKATYKGKSYDCNVVECQPATPKLKSELGYGRRVIYIEKKSMLTLKMDYYDEKMAKFKELRLLSHTFANNAKGKKVYYETGLEMKNVQTGTRTELLFGNLRFEGDANVKPDIFTEQYLNKKWW